MLVDVPEDLYEPLCKVCEILSKNDDYPIDSTVVAVLDCDGGVTFAFSNPYFNGMVTIAEHIRLEATRRALEDKSEFDNIG